MSEQGSSGGQTAFFGVSGLQAGAIPVPAGDTIYVSNAIELAAALNSATAGDQIKMAAGTYGALDISGLTYGGAVTISSQDPASLARFDSIRIENSSNIAINGVHVDNPTNGSAASSVVRIDGSQNITISNSEINGLVDDYYQGHYGVFVGASTGVRIEGNDIHNVKNGITVMDSNDMALVRNDFDYIGNDAIKAGGVERIVMDGNIGPDHWHVAMDAHPDFIQFQSSPSGQDNFDVLIINNVAIHGDVTRGNIYEGEFQGIFAGDSVKVHNIHVENNLIVNDLNRAISIGDSDVIIKNNTILNMSQVKDSFLQTASKASLIYTDDPNAEISNNIVASTFNIGRDEDNNLTLQYTDPNAPFYYDDIFANASKGRSLTFEDLQIVNEELTGGAGARFSNDWTSDVTGATGGGGAMPDVVAIDPTPIEPTPAPEPEPIVGEQPEPVPDPQPGTGSDEPLDPRPVEDRSSQTPFERFLASLLGGRTWPPELEPEPEPGADDQAEPEPQPEPVIDEQPELEPEPAVDEQPEQPEPPETESGGQTRSPFGDFLASLFSGARWGRVAEAEPDTSPSGSETAGNDPADHGADPASPAVPAGEVLASLDFETGLADLSEYDSALRRGDEDNLVEGFDGQAYRIGDRDRLEIERGNDQIHSLDKFALELDIQLLEDDSSGRFIHFNGVMEAAIEKDRSISFKLITDEGWVTLNSGSVTFDDGEPHTFSVAYDDAAGRVAMAIDDQIVDSAALTGTTASRAFFGLSLGETWRDAPTALIDNFFLGTDAEDVGIDLSATVGDALLANMVDPDPDYGTSEGDDLENDGLYKDGNSAFAA